MNDRHQIKRDQLARDIFLRALELESIQTRAAYLDGTCQGDAPLRARVEALLESHRQDSFLQTPVIDGPLTVMSETVLSEGPGTVVGRYKLLQRIGEGGFGVVYMAEQKEPVKRRVALKIIKLGMDTKQIVARFEAERQALALMNHPNIAKVLDAGATETGRPYFVMELVRGIKITEYCDQNRLSARERLELVIQICHAIQHAHQKGIIHRDIKPSNILVTLHDGVPVPQVIDFGIAKATQQELTEKTVFTQFQQMIGTPAYMSPEQAEMSGLDIDTRTDIYSLGVLLYELLTGKTPLDGQELLGSGCDEIRRRIKEEEPLKPSTRVHTLQGEEQTTVAKHRKTDPSHLGSALKGDIDWIVMKCLEKDRTRRYETASAFAGDIQRCLRHEPISAAAPSLGYVFAKYARRHKTALVTGACLVGLLLTGTAVSLWQALRATRAQRLAQSAQVAESQQRILAEQKQAEAEIERGRTQISEAEARRNLYVADMLLASLTIQENDLGRARELLARHESGRGSEVQTPKSETDLREWEWRYFRGQVRTDELFVLQEGSTPIRGVAFLGNDRLVTATDGVLHFWDLRERRLDRSHPHGRSIQVIKASPDSRLFAAVDEASKHVLVWDAARCEVVYSITAALHRVAGGQDIEFLPDGRKIVVVQWLPGAPVAQLVLANMDRPDDAVTVLARSPLIQGPACSPDGRRLAYQDQGDVIIRNLASDAQRTVGSPSGALIKGDPWSLRMTFSDDGNYLTLVDGRTVHRVDAATGRLIHTRTNQLADSAPVIFSRDVRKFISLGADQHIRVQGLAFDAPDTIYATVRDECIDVSPDGRLLATGAWDGAVRVWDAQPEPSRDSWAFLKQPGTKRLSLDGRRLIAFQWLTNATAGSVSTVIGMWDVPSGRALADFSVSGPKVREATAVWPGNHLALFREDDSVEIWQPDGPELTTRFPLVPATIYPETIDNPILFAFDEGRRLLAVHGTGDNTIWVAEDQLGPLGFYWFDVPQRRLSRSSSIHPGIRVTCGDCSRDGRFIALGGFGGEVLVIDVANGTSVRTLTGRHQKWVMDVEFSPDGQWMATAGNEGFVRLWETASWREIGTHRIHGSSAMSLAFHPSARRLVVGTIGTISILETDGLRPLTTITGPASQGVTRLDFLNEDTLLGWIGRWRPHASDTMTVWHAPSFEEIASMERP